MLAAVTALAVGALVGAIQPAASARAADEAAAIVDAFALAGANLARAKLARANLAGADVAGRIALAARAEASDPDRRAGLTCRDVLVRDTKHEPARPAVTRMGADPPLPRQSAACDDAWKRLPATFQVYETKRYVVLSDADPHWARDQAELLERTYHQFVRFARRHRLVPLPLRHKLVCLLFRERADYHVFAASEDGVEDPWIAGYYAPAHDRVVFYHGDSNPSVVEARARLTSMRSDLDALRREAGEALREGSGERAEALVSHRRRYERHVQRESGRVDAFAQNVNTATSVHEAVHQLLFHTLLQSPHHPYPVWFSEGLATAFETDDTTVAFGPDHAYAPRREGFDTLLTRDELIGLRRLVGLMRVPNDERVIHAVYHQGYALITWMDRFRREELRAYFDLMLAEPAGEMTRARAVEIFVAAFGDVDRLERAWLRHERSRLTARALAASRER